MPNTIHRPPRLPFVFQGYMPPLYFVTFCTMNRRPILATPIFHDAFRSYAEIALEHGVGVGQYVIMPEHVHLFVRIGGEAELGQWVRGLKRVMGNAFAGAGKSAAGTAATTLKPASSIWQDGFFDHLLRRNESYQEKWCYVRDNPVRKGLVDHWEEWPYRGEIVQIGTV